MVVDGDGGGVVVGGVESPGGVVRVGRSGLVVVGSVGLGCGGGGCCRVVVGTVVDEGGSCATVSSGGGGSVLVSWPVVVAEGSDEIDFTGAVVPLSRSSEMELARVATLAKTVAVNTAEEANRALDFQVAPPPVDAGGPLTDRRVSWTGPAVTGRPFRSWSDPW